MVVIIMTNSFMGVSCFHRSGIYGSSYNGKLVSSCGFSNSQKLIYRVGWSRINVEKIRFLDFRMLTVGAVNALSKGETDNVLSGGGILEKEFEFRPTFDEYLKTLESVRTGREKKQTHRSDRDKVKHDSSGSDVLETPILERGEKDVKLRDSGGFPKGKKMSKVGKHQVNGNDKGIAAREGKVRHDFDHEERGIGESRNRLNREKRGRDEIVPIIVGGQAMKTKHSKDSRLGKSKKLQDPQEGSVISYNAHSKGSTIDKKGELGRNRTSTDMLGRKEKSFKGENFGVTLSKDRIQAERDAEKRTVSSSLRLIRSSKKASGNENYGSSLEMERAAFKNFEEPIDVVNKPGVPRIEMEERIQKLAKWLNGADIDVPEWTFSKTMRSAKIKYTDHTILRVIQILGKLGNWRRVLQVIEWLQMRERFKSHKLRYIYTTALHVLGKARRPVEALNVFHAMQQQMSSYPDLVAYHSIAVTLGQAGHMKELFDVIDSMKSPPKKMLKTSVLVKWDPRLEPDIVVYNAVLNACVQRKQWEGAFWVLQQLKQQGQRPTASTYGLVMEVMFACGKYNLVHEFFRKVQKSSIPNSLAYRVLVNTLWKEGKIDEAVWAVQDMERRGIVGSAALYYDLARCLCSAGRCQEGLMLFKIFCE
ncbi:pentatricopeptide repeat-containing protein At1g30610, chloroplastic [Carica papaya]|uniref:pentatricopeptide repeat-containing protein At1g30610, chloroplastic n=1 Tax=Carica papaya TaxID=3649 RepID=UPI000B8D0C41|nr:pentatricopeptide repeat-containing protein At1g30610, chloroplastic [Carica papaya]